MNKYTETLQTTKRLQGWSQKASIIVLNKLLIEKRGHAACMCMCMTCMWTRKHTSRRFGFSNDKVFWVKNTHPSQSTLCSRDGKSGENETKEERGVKERKYTKLQVEIIKVTLKFRSSLRRRGQMVFRGGMECMWFDLYRAKERLQHRRADPLGILQIPLQPRSKPIHSFWRPISF